MLAAAKRWEWTLPLRLPGSREATSGMWQSEQVADFARVIETAGALAGDAAGLPVVVLVEAAEPAVVIDGLIEVHLVAGGAVLGGVLAAHEILHEGAAVRLGIEERDEVVELADPRIVAVGDLVERRVHDLEIALSHGAADVRDGVAGDAAEAVLRFGRVDLLLDGALEAAVEEDGVVVAAGAPLTALRAAELLHVEDGGLVERVIEGREVVHGAVPLLVDVLVALAAELGIHEEIGGDEAAGIGAGGGGPERRARAFAFGLHGDGDDFGVADAVGRRAVAEREWQARRRRRGRGSNGEAGWRGPRSARAMWR